MKTLINFEKSDKNTWISSKILKRIFIYNKFIRNDRLLKYSDRMLMNDLILKLNKDLRSALVNNSRRFESIVQMKNHFILIDNIHRQI